VKIVPTRRTDYAVRALLYLAQHPGSMAKAADIAEAMNIPTGFLHQVLHELQRARLVLSRPGRSGGYSLARPAADISLLDVVETLEGPLAPDECGLRGGPCRWEDACALHATWTAAREALANELRAANLARLAADDLALAGGRGADGRPGTELALVGDSIMATGCAEARPRHGRASTR